MRTHEQIMRLYHERFGHSHDAAVLAVYLAGVEDGKEAQRERVVPPLPVATTTALSAQTAAGTVISTATTTRVDAPTPVPGKIQPR
jgi:hypothetical protein